MKMRRTAVILLTFGLVAAPLATVEAQTRPGRTTPRVSAPANRAAPAMRGIRTPTRSTPTRNLNRSQPPMRSGGARPSVPSMNRGRSPMGSGTRAPSGANLGDALSGIAERLGGRDGYGNYRGRDYYRYRAEREHASAYRDAAIAHAIVGLAEVVAHAAVTSQANRQAAAQPAGHYEVHRTRVSEGRHETERVWVPERVDPATGTVIEGHYQTHRRWIPPVYDETRVWVPAPTAPRATAVHKPAVTHVSAPPSPVARTLPPPAPVAPLAPGFPTRR